MRHGRKTKSKRFNGYKRHLAIDLDTVLVLAVAVLPANRPEQDATPSLVEAIEAQGRTIDALYIDRGYINAPVVDEIRARRGLVVCRPWIARNGEHFSKSAFTINMRDRTATVIERQARDAVLRLRLGPVWSRWRRTDHAAVRPRDRDRVATVIGLILHAATPPSAARWLSRPATAAIQRARLGLDAARHRGGAGQAAMAEN